MSFAIALSDEQWELVADLFDPPGRRGAPAVIPRRQMVDAMLFIGRTGVQWRYLPERYGPPPVPQPIGQPPQRLVGLQSAAAQVVLPGWTFGKRNPQIIKAPPAADPP